MLLVVCIILVFSVAWKYKDGISQNSLFLLSPNVSLSSSSFFFFQNLQMELFVPFANPVCLAIYIMWACAL